MMKEPDFNPQALDDTESFSAPKQHPLKEFAWLIAGFVFLVMTLLFVLSQLAVWLAPKIPFSFEEKLMVSVSNEIWQAPKDKTSQTVQAYLQALSDKLVVHADLPEGMSIQVHYSDDDVVNAYATLAGNIVIYQGLIDSIKSENGLAMVLAHEIAHVKHRHPIKSVSQSLGVGLLLSLFLSANETAIIDRIASNTTMLTQLSYSRDYEEESDETALSMLSNVYGHTTGAEEFFEFIESEEALELPEFMSTHPAHKTRLKYIHKKQEVSQGDVIALPDYLQYSFE